MKVPDTFVHIALGFTVVFSGLLTTQTQTIDLTVVPEASGEDVVLAAFSKIRNLFADDHRFLVRTAYVESKFGTDSKTFRNGYFGGIWQIGNSTFYTTKDIEKYPNLKTRYGQFQSELGIDWTTVEWKDLLKPLHSLLAAHLKLFTLGLKVPQNVEDQSRFWKTHYNSEQVRDKLDFTNAVRELEDCRTSRIKCQIDLVIVLDGSGSIGPEAYEKAKGFVLELTECMPFDTVHTGLIVYSEEVDVVFDMETYLSPELRKVKILKAKYPGLGTNTHLGMDMAVAWLRKRQETHTQDVPAVMMVLTDGHSSVPDKTRSTAFTAQQLGMTVFAIGVGPHIKRGELKLIAGPTSTPNEKVMQINTYKTLSDLLGLIQAAVCATARRLRRDVRIQENVLQNQVSYYAYQVPKPGIMVSLENPLGTTRGFYSYAMKTPSKAFNDGEIIAGFNYIPAAPSNSSNGCHLRTKRDTTHRHRHHHHGGHSNHNSNFGPEGRTVYIAIEGVQPINNFTIEVEDIKPTITITTTTETPIIAISTEIPLPEPITETLLAQFTTTEISLLKKQNTNISVNQSLVETNLIYANSSVDIVPDSKPSSTSSVHVRNYISCALLIISLYAFKL